MCYISLLMFNILEPREKARDYAVDYQQSDVLKVTKRGDCEGKLI